MASKFSLSSFAAPNHDHQSCVQQALNIAEHACAQHGLRLTHLRRRVLEIIWQSHAPVKAYDILEQLTPADGAAAPPTVYRALDFLREAGLVHRIESQNAYVGCGRPGKAHQGQFLICKNCGAVAEIDDANIRETINQSTRRLGFEAQTHTLEISGFCPDCRHKDTD